MLKVPLVFQIRKDLSNVSCSSKDFCDNQCVHTLRSMHVYTSLTKHPFQKNRISLTKHQKIRSKYKQNPNQKHHHTTHQMGKARILGGYACKMQCFHRNNKHE